MYGKGISREGSLIDMSVDLGIVKKSGAWFTYEGEQLGQGRENAKTFLTTNPEIMVEISDRVLEVAGLKPGDGTASPVEANGRRRRPTRVVHGSSTRLRSSSTDRSRTRPGRQTPGLKIIR